MELDAHLILLSETSATLAVQNKEVFEFKSKDITLFGATPCHHRCMVDQETPCVVLLQVYPSTHDTHAAPHISLTNRSGFTPADSCMHMSSCQSLKFKFAPCMDSQHPKQRHEAKPTACWNMPYTDHACQHIQR